MRAGRLRARPSPRAPAQADKISNPTAVFNGLDKITGRIITFEVAINETVQFGTLQITPRVCYSRPPTEQPQTDAFAQVDEIDENKQEKRIFSGWMFADSPGLHGVEHPIYDVWLTGCKGGTTVMHEAPQVEASTPDADNPDAASDPNAAQPPQSQPAGRSPPKKRPSPRPRPSSRPRLPRRRTMRRSTLDRRPPPATPERDNHRAGAAPRHRHVSQAVPAASVRSVNGRPTLK